MSVEIKLNGELLFRKFLPDGSVTEFILSKDDDVSPYDERVQAVFNAVFNS